MQRAVGRLPDPTQSRWRQFFSDPSLWWDNRSKKKHNCEWSQSPDFKHAVTGEGLWISSDLPEWVQRSLQLLADAPQQILKGVRAQSKDHSDAAVATKSPCFGGEFDRTAGNAVEGKQVESRTSVQSLLASLKTCTMSRDLENGKKYHLTAVRSRLDSDNFVAGALVNMYAKCGSMVDARKVFDGVANPDVVLWNALIMGYVNNGEVEQALELFSSMQTVCKANVRTYFAALSAYSVLAAKGGEVKAECLNKCREIHSKVAEAGFLKTDAFVANALMDLYAKCGSMGAAWSIFQEMPDLAFRQNVMCWTTLMLGYVGDDNNQRALELFDAMQSEGVTPDSRAFVAALMACSRLASKEQARLSNGTHLKLESLQRGRNIHAQASKAGRVDIYVKTTLVDMYARCGSLVDAKQVFEQMYSQANVVSWNALIVGYVENGEYHLALKLYASMKTRCAPNRRTYLAVLDACGKVMALETGKNIHTDIQNAGFDNDAILATCLVHFYSICGDMALAEQVVTHLDPNLRCLAIWNALITGYSLQGDTSKVFAALKQMQDAGFAPDGVTFLAILTTCSHAGLVDKGHKYFELMSSKYGITPGKEHYTCMIDLLGRANQLEKALLMLKEMPHEADSVAWRTLLGACRKWKNAVVGKEAFENVIKLKDNKGHEAAPYVLMANIYADLGMNKEVNKVMTKKKKSGVGKMPGKSWWTDESGAVHYFVVGDKKHPQIDKIQSKLKQLVKRMKEQPWGYEPELGSVLSDIDDNKKEDALCDHSEKLAISCALINTPAKMTIRIVKNLRVCNDCHKATAIISDITQRQIVCRDASRLHVFDNGKCSCGEFW